MGTESRNPRSIGLDKMSAREIVRLMNEEEVAVNRAIASAEAQIAEAAERAARAYQSGARVIYVGAGTSGRVATMDAAEMVPRASSRAEEAADDPDEAVEPPGMVAPDRRHDHDVRVLPRALGDVAQGRIGPATIAQDGRRRPLGIATEKPGGDLDKGLPEPFEHLVGAFVRNQNDRGDVDLVRPLEAEAPQGFHGAFQADCSRATTT